MTEQTNTKSILKSEGNDPSKDGRHIGLVQAIQIAPESIPHKIIHDCLVELLVDNSNRIDLYNQLFPLLLIKAYVCLEKLEPAERIKSDKATETLQPIIIEAIRVFLGDPSEISESSAHFISQLIRDCLNDSLVYSHDGLTLYDELFPVLLTRANTYLEKLNPAQHTNPSEIAKVLKPKIIKDIEHFLNKPGEISEDMKPKILKKVKKYIKKQKDDNYLFDKHVASVIESRILVNPNWEKHEYRELYAPLFAFVRQQCIKEFDKSITHEEAIKFIDIYIDEFFMRDDNKPYIELAKKAEDTFYRDIVDPLIKSCLAKNLTYQDSDQKLIIDLQVEKICKEWTLELQALHAEGKDLKPAIEDYIAQVIAGDIKGNQNNITSLPQTTGSKTLFPAETKEVKTDIVLEAEREFIFCESDRAIVFKKDLSVILKGDQYLLAILYDRAKDFPEEFYYDNPSEYRYSTVLIDQIYKKMEEEVRWFLTEEEKKILTDDKGKITLSELAQKILELSEKESESRNVPGKILSDLLIKQPFFELLDELIYSRYGSPLPELHESIFKNIKTKYVKAEYLNKLFDMFYEKQGQKNKAKYLKDLKQFIKADIESFESNPENKKLFEEHYIQVNLFEIYVKNIIENRINLNESYLKNPAPFLFDEIFSVVKRRYFDNFESNLSAAELIQKIDSYINEFFFDNDVFYDNGDGSQNFIQKAKTYNQFYQETIKPAITSKQINNEFIASYVEQQCKDWLAANLDTDFDIALLDTYLDDGTFFAQTVRPIYVDDTQFDKNNENAYRGLSLREIQDYIEVQSKQSLNELKALEQQPMAAKIAEYINNAIDVYHQLEAIRTECDNYYKYLCANDNDDSIQLKKLEIKKLRAITTDPKKDVGTRLEDFRKEFNKPSTKKIICTHRRGWDWLKTIGNILTFGAVNAAVNKTFSFSWQSRGEAFTERCAPLAPPPESKACTETVQ